MPIIPISNNQIDPVSGLTPTKTYKSPKINFDGPSHIGHIDENTHMGVNVDDYKKYVPHGNVYVNEGLEDARAYGQSTGEKWAHGVTKFLGKTGTAFLGGTVGSVLGLPNLFIENKSVYDTAFQRFLDNANEKMDEALPNYMTSIEKEEGFLQSLNNANFWANDVLSGLSFTAGAVLTELVWSAATAATFGAAAAGQAGATAGLVARAARHMKNFSKGASVVSKLNTASKLGKVGQAANIMRQIYTGAGYEGGVEARHHKKKLRDHLEKEWFQMNPGATEIPVEELARLEEIATGSANWVFAANLGIVGLSNMIALPRIFGPGIGTQAKGASRIARSVEGAAEKAGKTFEPVYKNASRLGKIAEGMYLTAKNPFVEGIWEEGMQNVANNTMISYTSKKYNPFGTEDAVSLIESFGDSLAETYGSKEGWKEIGIGMIIGSIGSPNFRAYKRNEKTKKLERRQDEPIWTGGIAGEFQERNRARGEADRLSGLMNQYGEDKLIEFIKSNPEYLKSTRGMLEHTIRSAESNSELEQALEKGDIFNAKNVEHDIVHSYIMARIDGGFSSDLVDEFAKTVQDMDNVEFAETFNYNDMSESELLKRKRDVLGNFEKKVSDIKKAVDIVDSNFKGDLTDSKNKNIREALIYGASVMDNVDYRENEVAKQIENLTGVIYDKEQRGTEYKEEFQSDINKSLENNPKNKPEVQALVKDLNNLQKRRETFIKQYNYLFTSQGQQEYGQLQEEVMKDIIKGIKSEIEEEYKGTVIVKDNESGKTFKKYDKADGTSVMMEIGEDSKPVTGEEIKVTVDDTFVGKYDIVKNVGGRSLNKEHSQRLMKRLNEFKDPDELTKFIIDEITPLNLANHDLVLKKAREIFKKLTGEKLDSKNPRYVDKIYKDKQSGKRVLVRKDNNKEDSYYVKEIKEKDTTKNIATVTKQELADNFVFEKTWRDYKNKAARIGNLEQMITSKEAVLDQQKKDGKTYRKELKELQQRYRDLVEKLKSKERDRRATKKTIGEVQALLDSTQNMIEEIQGKVNESVSAQIKIKSELKYLYDRIVEETNQDTVVNLKDKVAAIEEDIKVNEEAIFSWKHLVESLKKLMNKLLAMFEQAQLYIEKTPQRVVAEYEAQVREELMDFMTKGSPSEVSMVDGKFVRTPSFEWYQRQRIANEQIKRRLDSKKAAITRAIERGLDAQGEYQVSLQRIEQAENQIDSFEKDNERLFEQLFMIEEEVKSLRQYLKKQALTIGGYTPVSKKKSNKPDTELNPAEKKYQDKDEVPSDRVNREEERSMWSGIKRNLRDVFRGLTGRHVEASGQLTSDKDQRRYYRWTSKNNLSSGKFYIKVVQAFEEDRDKITSQGYNFEDAYYALVTNKEGKYVAEDGTTSDTFNKNVHIWTSFPLETTDTKTFGDKYYVPQTLKQWQKMYPGVKSSEEGQILFENEKKQLVKQHQILRERIKNQIANGQEVIFKIVDKAVGVPNDPYQEDDVSISVTEALGHNNVEVIINTDEVMTFKGKTFVNLKRGLTFIYDTVTGNIYEAKPRKINENETNMIINMFKSFANRSVVKNKGFIDSKGAGQLFAKDGSVVGDMFKVLTDLAFWSGDNTNEDGTAINKNEDKAFHFVKNFSIDGVNNVPGGAIKIGKQTFQLFVITKDGNVALNRAIADENGDGALKDFLSERNINIRSKNLRSNDDYVEFTSVDENGVATYKIHKGENGGYKSYLLGNEADGNNNVLGISVIPSGVEQEVGFDQDGNAIIEEVPQVFNQYAIYALEDDFVAKQTTQAKEERPNPNFTELPDIKIGERVRVTVTNDKTKAVEQNGVLEKNEDGVFVQKEGNLSANTITSINAVSKTKEGVTDYNEVLLKHNKTVAVGRVQPIEKKEPVVTPVAPVVETKSTPTDIEAKKADIESKPSAPKKVSGYLKGKRGNTFSIVENNSDRSFFVIFNEEGDTASFEFSGDEAEGIAKRVFSDDISETVSGSMKTAVNVYTVEAGQLKKVDDVWTVVKKTKVAFEKIQTQESKPTTTKRGANIDPYRTPTKDQRGTENLVEAENWFKKRFPNVDFNVVRHLIDGGYHGQFKNAAIYVYENAEVGTTYHEAFHVVTHLFLTKRERTSLYKEYRQRVPEAKNLSDSQIEEALAEEFRDYILSKETTGSTYDLNKYKTPLKRSFFQRLYDHIKNFIFGKPDTIAEVFEKIEANEYRNASPAVKFSENKVTLNRSFKTKDEAFTKAAMEGVNYFFFQALFSSENNVASLFTKESNRQLVKRLYDYSKDQIERRMGDLYEELQETTDQTDKDHIENAISGLQYLLDNWEFSTEHTSSLDKVNYSVVGLHKQFLSQYRIEFLNVENEISELNADSDPDNQWSNESIKISSKFSASKNIKLLLGTLIAVNEDNTSKLNILKLPQNADFGFTFNILANELAGVRSVGQMKTRILKLSQKHPHLNSLIRRLKLNVPVESITREDMLQQVQFVQTFAKTKNRYKFDITGANGKFKVIDSNSNSLKNKVLQQWKNNAAQLKTGYVTVEGAKVYDKDAFTTVGIVNSIEKALQTLRMLGIEFSNQDVVLQNESFKAEIIKKTESIRKQIISPKGQISIFNTEISTNTGGDLNYFLELEAQTTADFIENSHFNLDNNLVYDITLNSYVSNILNDIESSQTLDEFFSEHPHLDPENNPYTANSVLLKKDGLFFDKNGRLKRQIELEIHEGSREEESGVSKEFDDFNQPDQLRVHINRGLQGAYPLLRPADNSIERYINVGKPVLSSAEIANEEYIPIFFNYLRDELIRSKDIQGSDIKWDNISDKANQGVIISILSKNPQLKEELDAFFESEDVTIEDFFSNEDTVELIQDEVRKYFANRTDNMIKLLVKYGIVDPIEGGEYYNNGLNIEGNPSTITSPLLKTLMRNYIINDTIMNIEQTKILFGDPINYKNVEDQFKRHSGLVGTKKISAVYQEVNDWIERNLKRTDRKTALKKDGQPIIRTAVFSDVVVKSKYYDEYVKAIGKNKAAPYEKMDEGDGLGYIAIDEWREMLFRAGDWSFGVGSLESLYQYEIQKEAGIEKPIDPITKRVIDPNLLPVANPLKPQYFGPLAEDGFVVGFYKLSVFPLLPSVTKEFSQLENLRKGMKRTGTGIAVFKSANKVGTKLNENGKVQELYNDQGEFAYQDKDFITQDTYYKHWGIQVDMGSKTKKKVVSGTQMAKQIINGIYENGQPKNEKLGELTKEYLSLNAERITIGLAQLVDSLGMKIEGSNFRVENPQMIIDRFKKEAIERELPDNIVDAIDNLKLGTGVDTLVNREKIENIMFAIADSMTTSQKRSGSAKVQVSNAVGKLTRRLVNRETGQVWDSSDLKFYTNEDGKITQMEVYVPAYFRGKVTDSRLLDLIGFRIPTQGLNSIDSIKVVGFLPDSAGDSIIVPSEIVAKAGSDFDIDKLNIYYPNVYYDRKGNPKYIEFKNEDQLRKDYKEYEESFKVNFVKRILNREEFKGDITDASKILTKELQDVFSKEDFTINDIIEHIETRISDFESFIQDGTAKQKALYKETKAVYENILDLLYKVSNEIDNDNLSEFEPLSLMEFKKRGIENRISEIQKEIILHPDNFNQLITPISAKELSDEAKLIRELQGKPIVEKAEMNNIVEREYLLDVATRFIGGKKAVGITAVHSTFDILSKISNISIVPSFTIYSIADKKRITISTAINLPHNINDRGEISLSKLTNAFNNGNIPETLSQWINAAVDAAKDPFMFDLNAGPETLNTVLYLTMSGVPLKHLTRFMTQPIIVEFIENRSKWESQMMEGNTDITGKSKKKFRDEIVNLTKAKYVKHGKKPSDVSLFTVEQLEANIKKGARGTMDAEFAAQQLQVLDDFLRYVETAKKVGEAIRGVDYDTNAAGKNTSELLYKTRNTKNVKDEAVIVNFDKIFDTGFISPYYEAVQELNNIFRPFFITLKDTSVTKQFDKLFTLLFHERNNLSKEDKIKVLDKFKQSFITYLFLTRPFSMNNKLFKKEDTTMTMNSQLQRLFKGNNSIAHRLQEMKKKYPDMEFLKYLEPVISEDQSSTHHVISRNKKMDVIESNRYTNEWRELFNKEEQFAVDLMMSTLIQYGIENSPFTFTNLIPFEVYGDMMNSILQRESQLSEQEKDGLYDDFYNQFFLNNYNDDNIVPRRGTNLAAFYPFAKDVKVKPEYKNKEKAEEARSRGINIFDKPSVYNQKTNQLVEKSDVIKSYRDKKLLNSYTSNDISISDSDSALDMDRSELLEDYSQILGSKQNIQGFKDFVQGKQFQKLTAEEKAKTIEQVTKEHRSITALKDLSAKLAHRIGGKVKFENRTDVDWKGYNQGMTSVLNEAYMTPDTPFHEILAHPIIKAIKTRSELDNSVLLGNVENFISLYDSLLKELETSETGRKVFEQVKRDYKYKQQSSTPNLINQLNELKKHNPEDILGDKLSLFSNLEGILFDDRVKDAIEALELKIKNSEKFEYSLEEQQEEAIVTLLGLMAAEKLDAKKDATLISKLKELWKQISDLVKSLLKQDGIKIDELPITTTLNDLAEIMAYGNNKIILPGYKIEYSTPLGNKYETLEEVNNEIKGLADANVEVDLSNINIITKIKEHEYSNNQFRYFTEEGVYYKLLNQPLDKRYIFSGELNGVFSNTHYISEKDYNENLNKAKEISLKEAGTLLQDFISKNKEYEQSKEIIEQWKKENNIQYDPEEVYSRGQGFYSSIGAYSNLELDLLFQNLLQHIQDNKKAGGEFTISAFTKPIDKRLKHIEGTGDRVRFVIYPKSEHIKWAAPTDVYSGSVWDAHEKVSKDKKSELLGVSFTKAPALRNINEVSPNLADIIDNLSHAHNELGIELTTNNFRIEYDDNIDYSTKKLIDNVNKILDDKYGKLEKPEVKVPESKKITKFRVKGEPNIFNTREEAQALANKLSQIDHMSTYVVIPIQVDETIGKQPTQTRGNTTSIESVKNEVLSRVNYAYTEKRKELTDYNYSIGKQLDSKGYRDKYGDKINNPSFTKEQLQEQEELFKLYEEGVKKLDDFRKSFKPEKEYTSQAETNLKVAALKEVARKYPRILITSKVVPINPNLVGSSEIQYSKVGTQERLNQIQDIFNENPKLTSIGTPEQYSQYLDTIFPDSKVKDIVYHGTDVENLQQFDLKYFGQKDVGDRGYGIYLSRDKNIAQGYGEYLYSVLVNIQNPYNVRFKDNDPSYLWNRIARNSYKQDIEKLEKDRNKWIEKVNNNDIDYAFFEELPKNANKEVQLKFVNDRINKQISDKQERLNELVIINNSDGVINENYEIVTRPEQTHILGSKQDIEGFREFINSNNNPVWEQGDNEFNRITGQAKNKNSLFNVAKSFNIQTSGFFPAQISKELLRQELNKKGFKNITIATASSGNLYLKDSKGFIKIDRLQSEYFQLSTGSQESSDSQLNDKIKAWLRKAGITYQSVENITDRKGNPVSAIAKADMLHKIVQVVEGKADITTLPEEAAHFLVELLPEDSPLLRGMMNAIVGTDIYNEVVSEYSELYNGDQTMLKKEAVGKMIAKAIVRKEQVSRMSSFQRFWDAAWRWIKRHLSFLKSSDIETELAPFMEAADMVLGNVTDGLQNVNDLSDRIFYQVTTEGQAKEAKQIIEGFNQNKVTKDLTKGGYVTLEGKKVFNRVTDSVKEFYKRKFRKNVEDKPYNVTLALKGTILHKYLELAGEKIFNGEKVYWKEVESQVIRQLKDKNDAANVDFLDKNDAFFKLDENQFGELINGLNKIKEQVINKQKMIDPKGEVKFFPELLIYDQLEDVAGTIDLAVVYSNGTVGIYDYKGIDFNESQKLPLYKDQAYELQISLYKKILARAYGVKNFGETRIIPIDMKMTRTGAGYGKIAMGSTGLNDTKRPYLEQIPVDREMTDDAQLNISLTKMLNLHDKLAKQLSSDWKNEKLINRVERLKEAIRGLQLRGDVGFIFHEINSMYIDFNTRENLTEDSPYYMTLEYLSEVRETIEVYRKFGTNAMATAKKRESKETITNLERVAHMLDAMEQRVDQKVIEQLNKGENFNVEGKARAEGFTGRMFKQLSRFNRPTFKKLSKIVREVSDTVRKEVQETVEDVTEKTEALHTWAKSKGMSLQDAFDKIINPETGDLTSQYSKEFYESRDKAIKDKDKKWFLKNANVEEIGGNLYYTGAAKERFEKAKKEMFEYIDKTNEGDQLKEFRERRKQEWLSKYDITIKTEALFNNNNYFIKPENITSNFSKEYNYMLQPENKPLLDYYVMYIMYNMKFAEMTGKDINKYFVAEISKDLIDRVGQVGLNGLGEMRDSLLRALEVRDFDIVLGSIDPATGKPMSVIPMLFTDKLTSRLTSSEKKKIREEVGSEFQIGTKEYEFEVEKREKRLEYTKGTKSKSRDLSRSLVLFADVAYSYAHLNETEAAALALRDIMKTQGQETEIIDAAGKTVIDKFTKKAATMMGVPLSEIEAMESFINAYWYGQTTQGTDLSVKVGDKSYSLTKAYRMLMKLTSAAALGLKPILSAGNLLGLTSNYYMTGAEGSYYNKRQMKKTNGMLVRKDPLFIGAVGFFEPFVHNLTLEKANNLSVSKLVSVVTFENVFILYKKGDELIDNCILGSMMQNYGIEDGKIKRIDKIQGEDKRSLLDRSSIVNDKFVVEGLTSEAYTHFRSMVQRAAVGIKGNMPSEDRNLIGTTLAGQALMHFRSWMPGLIEKRFKGLQHDDVFDDYDVGRFRVFFGEFSGKTVPSKLKAFANLLGEMAMMNIYDKKGVNMEVTQKFYDRHMQENPDSKLTMDEFVELRKAKLRGMAKELQIYLGFLAMVFLGRAALPDDEDAFANKAVRLLAQNAFRVTQRGLLELSFFFDPSSVTTILNRPLPTLTIINNTVKMLINTVDETRDVIFGKDYKGRIFWEEDKNDKTPRLYYFSKVVPIATSFSDFFDIFDTFNKNSKF